MDSTPNLQLPYLIAAQAQKHVTHNEALRALDAIVQLLVLDKDLASPPGSPADGSRYIVAASPTGAWAGHAADIAAYQDGAWMFYTPREGWLAWVADEDKLYVYGGSAWGVFTSPGSGAPLWGVNATADTTNRLAVKSAASLLDNVGGGHQQKINKAAAGDTASTLYQTGYSGRAEYGLTGDDNFHVKVSPDGSSWKEAIVVDRTTAAVGIGTASPDCLLTISQNSSGLPSAGSGVALHLVGADGAGALFFFDSFGGVPQFQCRRANGTAASPSALLSGDAIGGFVFKGYGATGYTSSNRGFIQAIAAENWSDTAQGTAIRLATTGLGTSSAGTERMRIDPAGNVGIGATAPSNRLSVEGIAAPETDNSYTLGTSSKRWSQVYAATGTINTSDGRLKTNIVDSPLGLGFILECRPRAYQWLDGGVQVEWSEEAVEEEVQVTEGRAVTRTVVELRDGVAIERQVETVVQVPVVDLVPVVTEAGEPVVVDGAAKMHAVPRMMKAPVSVRRVKREVKRAGQRTHYGLVAQEVKGALDRAGVSDFAGWVLGDKDDPVSAQRLRYDQFIAPLIKAVQELAGRVQTLEARLAAS